MRKLLSLLTALLFVGTMWATDVSITSFSTTSGSIDKKISYAAYKGNGTTDPAVSSNTLRIYKPSSGQSDGGYITVTATSGYAISSITFTNANDKAGTYKYSVDGGSLSTSASIAKEGTFTYNTTTFSSISFYNCGSDRLSIAGIAVTYASTGPTLTSISVETSPKLTYKEGDYFDPTGLVITRTYSDESTSNLTYADHESDFTFSPSLTTALTTSDVSVSITYEEKSTSQDITVTGCSSSIEITKGTPEHGSFDLSVTGVVCIDEGNASATISNIEPADGYRFKQITSSGGGSIDNDAKTVTNISANTTINVEFEAIPAVHAVSNNNEYGTVSVEGTTITAEPAECYRVKSGVEGFSVTEGDATVTHEGNSNTLTVNPETECTIQVIFEKNVNTYIDNIQGNDEFEDCDTKAPKLADKTVATTGTCIQQHYHFVGWVSEANLSNITANNVKAGGANIAVDGTTYYAVWAKKKSGDVYTISIDGAGLQAAVADKSSYSSVNFEVGGYTFTASSAMKCTTKAITGWFQLKKNNDYILIPELPGKITNISSTAIKTVGGESYSNSLYFNSSATTSKAIASVDLSNATSFSLDIEGNAKTGYFLAAAAMCINQLSVTYSTVEYTDSIAICKETITIDSEIAGGSVDADKETASVGETITLSNEPSTGYDFVAYDVYKTGESGTKVTVSTNTFSMPAYAVTVSASFSAKNYAVTLAVGSNALTAGAANIDFNASALTITTAPTGTGSLDGFYTKASDGTKVANANGSLVAGNVDGFVTDGKWSFANTATLYAVYDGEATALDNTDAEVKAVKTIVNGQLFIEKNGHIFNAQGQLVK